MFDQIFLLGMFLSLRQAKINFVNEGHFVKEDVTNATIMLISIVDCGKEPQETFSKSKLANYLFEFQCDPYFGEFRSFFTKD